MKLRIAFVASVLLALVGSFFAGAYRERVAYDHLFMRSLYREEALDTEHQVRVLTYLREGRRPDALSTLETLLDSSLTTFVRYDQAPPSERDDSVLHAIRDAREYREKHPLGASYTNADQPIQAILNLGR